MTTAPLPPKPVAREPHASLWRHFQLFKKDILSAQPARLYRAWMAEFKTPFFGSYLVNQPSLVRTILQTRSRDFPKSARIGEGLRPLLGESVFLTNGDTWLRQRRMIDPAFEHGRVKTSLPAMWAAADAAAQRLTAEIGTEVEIEEAMSHATADVIFRTLFSIPIDHHIARAVFREFRTYQRAQPILNLAAFVRLPRWMPRGHRHRARRAARRIRELIAELVTERQCDIAQGTAPDDLATKIMCTRDPETGARFSNAEMRDQVAIFFLAGHETSASALSWTLYLLALHPEWQDKVATEAAGLPAGLPTMSDLAALRVTRDVFREALRLYPPVPMMVRENERKETFRDRVQHPGSQFIVSPWHLHRHERLWDRPDLFDPTRFTCENAKSAVRQAYMPFSSGPRVCPGAGFAMAEAVLILARLVQDLRFEIGTGPSPVPVAHLTVRAKEGIYLQIARR